MRFLETQLEGVVLIEPERHEDERGWFARIRCEDEFRRQGLESRFVQTSLSYNHVRGVLRGMHLQVPPKAEAKLVRCIRGGIYDVVIDLRPDSPSFTRYFGAELTGENRRAMYVPKGFAHGFQVLADGSEILYEISEFYSPEHARGVRWDDPAFGIRWPVDNPVMLERDRSYPDFDSRILQ